MISNVRGAFSSVRGTVAYDSQNVAASKVDVEIDATTINTLENTRDTHLKSPDFLNVEKYPSITFRSKAVSPDGDGELRVKGDLTIHGVTKEVLEGERTLHGRERPVREYPDWGVRYCQDQAERIRTHLERPARNWRNPGWRRSQNQRGSISDKDLKEAALAAAGLFELSAS